MTELTITASQIQGEAPVTILHLKGHLHGATEKLLDDRAHQAYEDGARHLLLDLTELEVLSSAGLRVIQNTFKRFTPPEDMELIRKHGEEPYKSPYFKMVCPNQQIYYVLNITGFLYNIPIYTSMDDAVKSFG